MKKSFRKIATSLLLVVLTVAMAVAFTGCKKKADEIYIDGQPRLTYVVGQDLDFASASLVAVRKNKSEKLAFTSEEVFVTGYDKNQVNLNVLGYHNIYNALSTIGTPVTII